MEDQDMQLTDDEEKQKKIMKEAMTEWLDSQFAKFGKWTMAGLVSMGLFAIVFLWLQTHGWQPPAIGH